MFNVVSRVFASVRMICMCRFFVSVSVVRMRRLWRLSVWCMRFTLGARHEAPEAEADFVDSSWCTVRVGVIARCSVSTVVASVVHVRRGYVFGVRVCERGARRWRDAL